jgi:hypothetical protein
MYPGRIDKNHLQISFSLDPQQGMSGCLGLARGNAKLLTQNVIQ